MKCVIKNTKHLTVGHLSKDDYFVLMDTPDIVCRVIYFINTDALMYVNLKDGICGPLLDLKSRPITRLALVNDELEFREI